MMQNYDTTLHIKNAIFFLIAPEGRSLFKLITYVTGHYVIPTDRCHWCHTWSPARLFDRDSWMLGSLFGRINVSLVTGGRHEVLLLWATNLILWDVGENEDDRSFYTLTSFSQLLGDVGRTRRPLRRTMQSRAVGRLVGHTCHECIQVITLRLQKCF